MIDRVHSISMSRHRSHALRLTHVTLGLVGVFLLTTVNPIGYSYADAAAAGGGVTHVTSGTYRIQVTGFFSGNGQASVGGSQVHISATLKDKSGADGLVLRANVSLVSGRFNGTGTLGATPISIQGRVDSGDGKRSDGSNQSEVRVNPRIVATFTTSDGRGGRIFGQPDHSQQPG
ncbi:MAG TPA: hypothetical protein VH370_14910 [Humisphaera sp.]|jgi:hypothetical protein|nr:hypothetical protein [Humisphaera sp.]